MTRSASGHGPRTRSGMGSGSGRGAKRSAPSAAEPSNPGGSRVTAPGGAEGPGGRRTLLVRVAVIAFVALLLAAMLVGCAKYDGDRAAFCAQLPKVPSFAQLSVEANSGTRDQAAASMRRGAAQFRALERIAPRTVRHTVASLGDSAERIAARLERPVRTEFVEIGNADGSITKVPVASSESQSRIGVFYDEMQAHRGTVSAVYSLMKYARDDCGITDSRLDLGLFGFDGSDTGIVGFGGDGVPLEPEVTVAPNPSGRGGWGTAPPEGSGDSGGVDGPVDPAEPTPSVVAPSAGGSGQGTDPALGTAATAGTPPGEEGTPPASGSGG